VFPHDHGAASVRRRRRGELLSVTLDVQRAVADDDSRDVVLVAIRGCGLAGRQRHLPQPKIIRIEEALVMRLVVDRRGLRLGLDGASECPETCDAHTNDEQATHHADCNG
jgi:hypothetical protein